MLSDNVPQGGTVKRFVRMYIEGIDQATINVLEEKIGETGQFLDINTLSGEKPLLFSCNRKKLRNLVELFKANPERKFRLFRQENWGDIVEISVKEFLAQAEARAA